MHKSKREKKITGRGPSGKAIVMGILERNGEAHAAVVPNRERATLHPMVREHIEAGTELFADAHSGYTGLDADYLHSVIDHAVAYVEGKVHTNGMENFWSLLKRSIDGTYVSIEPFHLTQYLGEQAYRYNHRKENGCERFQGTTEGIVGRRLTYAELTGRVKASNAPSIERQERGKWKSKEASDEQGSDTGGDTIPAV